MRYSATLSTFGEQFTVIDIILTESRLSVDWDEDGSVGHLEANSTDGVTFNGNYGYSRVEDWRQASFRLYRSADGGAALIGTWCETGGNEGRWLIVLSQPERTEGNARQK